MTHSPLLRRLLLPGLVLASGLAATTLLPVSGCSKASEVQPAESPSQERVDALEQRLKTLEQERDAAVKSAGAAGLEAQSMAQVLADLRSRLKAVEERGGAAPAAMADGASPTSAGSTGPSTVPPGTSALAPVGPDGSYTEDQITAFRKISDEVQKRKDAEQQAERVRRQLKSANVSLSAQQEDTVIRLQAQYQEKMRDLYRAGFGTTDAERQDVQDKLKALKVQWESDIRSQIPAAEADKIVESMSRGFPGVFPRRIDGRTGGMVGGMSGN